MPKKRSWSETQLKDAVKNSKSYRNVIIILKLQPTGGNYDQVKKYIKEYDLSTKHFTGKLWSKGSKLPFKPLIKLKDILVKNSTYQCYF